MLAACGRRLRWSPDSIRRRRGGFSDPVTEADMTPERGTALAVVTPTSRRRRLADATSAAERGASPSNEAQPTRPDGAGTVAGVTFDMATSSESTITNRLMSEAEFLRLPETKTKTELLDGELVCEPSPGDGHQDRLGRLYLSLAAWAASQSPKCTVRLSPLDVRFAPGRILQPDLLVFREPLVRPVKMPIDRIPDLCIEIVSTRRVYDRVTKRLAYAEAGVPEYWTVVHDLGFVERWTGKGLATREELRDRLVTPLLPGFELDVNALLAD
jgi:Uma2 family endonuclease